ncbi:MAG: hypothetical protein RPV21_08015 [Candidatus Sedimenticola sp. (ex Thyasira tokunagai)]
MSNSMGNSPTITERFTNAIETVVHECGGRGGVHPTWRSFPIHTLYVSFEPVINALVQLNNGAVNAAHKTDSDLTYCLHSTAIDAPPGMRALPVYSSADLRSFINMDTGLTHRYRYHGITLSRCAEVKYEALDRTEHQHISGSMYT